MLLDPKKFEPEINRLKSLKNSSHPLAMDKQDQIKQRVLEQIKRPVVEPKVSWKEKISTALKYFVPALLGLSILGGTAFAAAGSSKPGDVLYPVKIAGEKVQLGLTVKEESKAQLKAKFAQERLNELVKLAEDDNDGNDNSNNGNGSDNHIVIISTTSSSSGLSLLTSASIDNSTSAASTTPTVLVKTQNRGKKNPKNMELQLEARQKAEAEVDDALKALTNVQTKLKNKGDEKAAAAIGNNIVNLENNARMNNILNSDEDKRGQGFRQDGAVQGTSTIPSTRSRGNRDRGDGKDRSSNKVNIKIDSNLDTQQPVVGE